MSVCLGEYACMSVCLGEYVCMSVCLGEYACMSDVSPPAVVSLFVSEGDNFIY